MTAPEVMSRDELIVLVGAQADRIAAAGVQIAAMVRQISELVEANEALAAKLARLEYLLSRNSGNSSSAPSKDEGPGTIPPEKVTRGKNGLTRKRGKQPGRRERIWPGPRVRTITSTGSRRVAAVAERIEPMRPIWG